MQASTRPARAPLAPYVHLQIMIAATLLLKCLTVTYLSQSECKTKSTIVRNFFTKFYTTLKYFRHLSSGREPNFAALSTGRHLYSSGRPSRWALAHAHSSLWSPYVIGQTIYIFILFLSFFFFFFFFFFLLFFPRLISAVGDWMSTILRHMVWS